MSDDLHSLVGAYAMDALEATERAQMERHLDECAECREELASFAHVTSVIADAQATAPPVRLRSRVMETVSGTSQLTPLTADARTTEVRGAPHGRARRWLPAMVGAAASAVVLAVVALSVLPLAGDGEKDGLALEKDVMMVTSAPDAQSMDLDLGNGHVVKSERMEGLALMGAAAPMPSDGMEYQVWLMMADGTAMPGPTFMPEDDGEYMAVVHTDLDDVAAVSITEEPAGGSEHPTAQMMHTVGL